MKKVWISAMDDAEGEVMPKARESPLLKLASGSEHFAGNAPNYLSRVGVGAGHVVCLSHVILSTSTARLNAGGRRLSRVRVAGSGRVGAARCRGPQPECR